MQPSIHQRYADDILIGATVTATPAPMATYDEATLLTHRPADRVRWSTGTVSLQFDLGAGSPAGDQQADVLVIPCWNADGGGSPSIVTLTSSTGMNVQIPGPAMMPSGIPRTWAADLTVLEPDVSKRTASQFTLTVTGNSVDLVMGGAVLLYGPKREFIDRDWHAGFTNAQRGYVIRHENEYGTDLVYPLRTKTRQYALTTICTEAEALDLELWADANYGSGLPGTIWPIPDVYEAFFGRLDDVQTQTIRYQGSDHIQLSLTFSEISKGKPVA